MRISMGNWMYQTYTCKGAGWNLAVPWAPKVNQGAFVWGSSGAITKGITGGESRFGSIAVGILLEVKKDCEILEKLRSEEWGGTNSSGGNINSDSFDLLILSVILLL